ncbi:hypothetical protein [Streptomyces pactum]|uniref:hypothetical protein n=1 Tax=Streptomyces pactum TaxID=68249 RepID=UPI0036F61E3C
MRSPLSVLGAVALLTLPAVPPAAADDTAPSSFTIEDERITESSGLAASRAHPGVYWTHNDSDDGPYVFAIDGRTGRTVATVTLRGIGAPRDVEAVSVGPDGQVYVGDIGDNLGGTWSKVWIYRFPEPERLRDVTVDATQFDVVYEGGPRNAEALMVHPRTGRVYIASKSEEDAGLYEGPVRLSPSGVNTFRRVADLDLEITDGAFAPDGSRLVLRAYFGAEEYRWGKKGLGAEVAEQPRVPLQRQGESVTFTPDGGTLMFGTEGEGSRVSAVGLEGEQLPDATARRQGEDGDGDRRGGGTAGGDDGDGGLLGDSDLLIAAAALGVALLALLGFRGGRGGGGRRRSSGG